MTALQDVIKSIENSRMPQPDKETLLLLVGNLLTKERQQIIDAYNQGYRDGESTGASGIHTGLADVETFADAELYFNILNKQP